MVALPLGMLFEVGLASFVGGLVLLVYGGAPLLVKAKQHQRARMGLRAASPDQFPDHVQGHLEHAMVELASLGFDVLAAGRSAEDVPNVFLYLVLFARPGCADVAAVSLVEAAAVDGRRLTSTIAFQTEFTNAPTIETTNFRDSGLYPPDPNKRLLAIPGLSDVALLYDVHRRRVQRLAPAHATPKRMSAERALESVIDDAAADLRRVADAGYYWLDADAGIYCPTYRGPTS
jgi:hypothetical protein